MKCKFIQQTEKYNMLSKGDTVIVGLSGGADSVSLLHLINCVKEDYGINLIAAHVNHCLRGDEADRDEAFVRKLCDEMGVDLRVLKIDVAKTAAQRGEGTEECGRNIRYEFFGSIDPDAKVATAHTLSDNLETVLLNLTRGSVLNGLCGIPAVRGNIIRPLLTCTRDEIEKYCNDNGLCYVTDSTNLTDEYNRNKIRNSVIPVLKEINPSVETALERCVEALIEDEDYLSQKADEVLERAKLKNGWNTEILKKEPSAVLNRAIRSLLYSKTNGKPQKYHVELVCKLLYSGGAVQLSENYTARVVSDVLDFRENNSRQEHDDWSVPFCEGKTELPFGKAESTIIYKKDFVCIQNVHKDILENCLDYDKIIGKAEFRNRRAGDTIKQCSGNCSKSLKKLFNEKKIPAEERAKKVILSDENGVVWLEGYGCDERCKIDDKTERILKIVVERY